MSKRNTAAEVYAAAYAHAGRMVQQKGLPDNCIPFLASWRGPGPHGDGMAAGVAAAAFGVDLSGRAG